MCTRRSSTARTINTCEDQPAIGWFTPDEEALGVDNTANFNNPAPGVFCFQQLPFHAHNLVANIGPGTGAASNEVYFVQTQVGTSEDPIPAPCSPKGVADLNAVVYIRDANGALVEPDHSTKVLALFN